MTKDSLGPVRHVIGTRYVESVKPYILELTHLAQAIGPGDISTGTCATCSDCVIIDVDEHGVIADLFEM